MVDMYDIKETLYNVRQQMNDNPIYMYIAAGGLFFVCIMLVVCQFTGGGSGSSRTPLLIYFDTTNETIKLVKFDPSGGNLPNSPLDGAPETYAATIFVCGECPKGAIKDGMTLEELKAAGLFIGWLEKVDRSSASIDTFNEYNYSYRALDGTKWVKGDTEAALKIINAPYETCEDVRPCSPY